MFFLWKRGILFRELVIHKKKKSIICIFLNHCYIPDINNPLLIPDFFCEIYDYVFMTPLLTSLRVYDVIKGVMSSRDQYFQLFIVGIMTSSLEKVFTCELSALQYLLFMQSSNSFRM